MVIRIKGKIGIAAVALCLAFMAFTITAQAGDIYVPGDYSTIQAAINAAASGNNTVVVAAGTYSPSTNGESFPITFPAEIGQWHRYITVQGAGAGLSILDAEGTGAAYGGVMCLEDTGNNVVIDGFTMTGGEASFHGGGIMIVSYGNPWSKPTIQNCEIRNNRGYGGGGVTCQYAGQFSSTDYPRFINCSIVENASTGYGGGGVEINDCKAHFINCTIAYNLDLSSWPASVYLDNANAYLVNCVITSNHYSGTPMAFDSYSGSDAIQVNYCNFNPSHNLCPLLAGSGNNINVSPGFVDGQLWYPGYFPGGGDYHLTETSPMIDQGTSSGFLDIPSDDIDGDSRVAPPDIGSDEYAVGGPTCVDNDGDGYGVCPDCGTANGCDYDGDDCDDTDPDVNPGETETTCNGVDDDCNAGTLDAPDADSDTWDVCDSEDAVNPDGKSPADCNDGDGGINPGETETTCNGIDDDCNAATLDAPDADIDTYDVCNPSDPGDSDGKDADCDDGDDSINPGATDIPCNSIDEDCSGADDCDMPASAAYNTHISGTGKGPDPLACADCHSTGGGETYLLAEMVSNGNCDDCHSPDGAYDGVNDATIGAAPNWPDGVYEADGVTLKAGKKHWCAGCHDDVPAANIQDPLVPTEIVVNDSDATYVCAWNYKTGKSPNDVINGDFHWLPGGTGSCTATWTPNVPQATDYNVYAWWYSNAYRATDAKYTIYYASGSETVEVNQQVDGSQWNLLGTYPFAAGTSGYVVLSDEANGQVIADGILLETGGLDPVVYAPSLTGDNSTWGYFINGHYDSGMLYCDTCHDAGKDHIDGDWRTYEVDDATGVAINAYVDSFRLKDVDGLAALVVPRRSPPGNPMNAMADFALCMDCHSAQEVLSIDVAHTNFWNDDADIRNAHYIHLGLKSSKWDSDNDGGRDSAISCLSCHNPHGTPTPAMTRHGELISTYGTTDKVPALNFSYLGGATLAASTGGQMAMAGASILANGVCDNCHGAVSYSRTPRVLPKVIDGTANPDVAPPDGATGVILSALVIDHDGSLIGVSANLNEIGGLAAEPMYDDGDPLHGDAVSGDGFYSCKTTVSSDRGFGLKNLTVTATNAQGDGINVIQLNVLVAGVYIIDDPAAAYTEAWRYVSKSGAYNGDLHFKDAGTGSGTAMYTPDITDAGAYKVYAWWKPYWNRATNAPYTIYYDGGSETVYKDQTVFSGDWELLGTWPFAAGTGGSVVLSDNADGQLIADGIKFEKQ